MVAQAPEHRLIRSVAAATSHASDEALDDWIASIRETGMTIFSTHQPHVSILPVAGGNP